MGNKEVIIFGAGVLGEKFIYQYFDKLQISCFWDNKKSGEVLGYPVRKPQMKKNCFIIVASVFYMEIRKQLIQMGYCEFKDFIPYQIFQKKMAIAYGNCHIGAVKRYLERHKEFDMEYGFYPFPMIYELANLNCEYISVLQHCQLFLHQSIRKANKYGEQYASEYMLQHLPKNCDVIALPNLYGMPGYLFPQLDTTPKWQIGRTCPYFIDRNIVTWLENGKSIADIRRYIIEGGVYTRQQILDMWELFIQKVSKREKEWDIRVIDYIITNQKRKKIFCDVNHITSETAQEISRRVLQYMNYKEQKSVVIPMMDDLEVIIYKDVKEALGLAFEESAIRVWGKENCFGACEMNADEYINQLCQFTRFCLNGQQQ